MPLELLNDLFGSCSDPKWNGSNDAINLVVEKNPVAFDLLRRLEPDDVFVENLSSPTNPKIQTDFNSRKPGELTIKTSFRLRLPRIINKSVVAKNLADLLSLSSATYKEPRVYFLVSVEDSDKSFCFNGPASLSSATPLVKRYHDALKLWQAFESQAEHSVQATHNLLFFGIRKTEIAPRFSVKDLEDDDIALPEILEFISNKDREETRREIFRSVLSEFLQYQNVDRAFSFVLRQSAMFARKLKEGLAIYLSEHSPEKLAQEARTKYLELVEKLEKIVGGMEAKSLTIPAAVLFAVKEADFGGGWTTLNTIIIISTALYLITMFVVFLSQSAILNLLKTTIDKTTKELKAQGLDENNPILSDSFSKLEIRLGHTQIGSRFIFGFSFVPLLAVIYAVFCACPSEPSSYTIKLTPTNGVQIIQNTNATSLPLLLNTNLEPAKN
jgi:hypothetical protein